MKWHIAHRHEIPTAFDTLGKDYETKIAGLEEENTLLKQNLLRVEKELMETKLKMSEEVAERARSSAETQRLQHVLNITIMALAYRDMLIREKLNIQLDPPFK